MKHSNLELIFFPLRSYQGSMRYAVGMQVDKLCWYIIRGTHQIQVLGEGQNSSVSKSQNRAILKYFSFILN